MKEGASTLVERRSLLPAPLLASPGGAFQASPSRTPPQAFLSFPCVAGGAYMINMMLAYGQVYLRSYLYELARLQYGKSCAGRVHEEEPARAAIRKARTTGRLDCTECWHACRQAAQPHCCIRSCMLGVSFALWKRCRRHVGVRRVDLMHWPPADGYAVLACGEEATSIVKER